jgi:hypothetical protein
MLVNAGPGAWTARTDAPIRLATIVEIARKIATIQVPLAVRQIARKPCIKAVDVISECALVLP